MTDARAGWATIDITPDLGVPLGGRGPQFAGFDEVLDPLVAQACVLEDHHGRRVLFVSLDVVGIGTVASLRLRNTLATMTGVPLDAIVINFSHTHSGPMTIVDKYPVINPAPANLLEYESVLEQRIVSVALDACSRISSVLVSQFRGATEIGMNRRRPDDEDEIQMNPDPRGYVNRDVWGLDVRRNDGSEERCIVFLAACHAVTVYSWKWQACSADYPGAARRSIEESVDGCTHAQFLQGFAGNVRPARLAEIESGTFRRSVAGDHEAIGRTLASDVSDAIERASSPITLEIGAAAGSFQAARDPDRVLPYEHWQSLAESDSELDANLGAYWADAIQRGAPLAAAVPWEIGLMRFSPQTVIAWMAGEVCGEWLPLIRSWTGIDELIGVGYCQDLPSYLPTSELIEQGGYEVIRSNWYRKTGPGPYRVGIESAARKGFERLARQLSI